MKKLNLLIVLSIVLFACSPNEENEVIEVEVVPVASSDILEQYHLLSSITGEITNKYYFDADGRFIKHHTVSNAYSTNYEYDVDNKVSSIVLKDLNDEVLEAQDVFYDAFDNVTYIGHRKFKYDPTDDFYSETSSHQIAGPFINGNYEEYEYSYNKFYFDAGNPIPQFCYMEGELRRDLTTGVNTDTGVCGDLWTSEYQNGNVTSKTYGGVTSEITYDTEINPMFDDNTTNFSEVLGFLYSNAEIPDNNHLFIVSTNRKVNMVLDTNTFNNYTSYSYIENTLGLPATENTEFYENGTMVNQAVTANYYYEGDIIPD